MKITGAYFITLLITTWSWLLTAFQGQWSPKRTSLYKSVSGLLTSSSQALSSLAPHIGLRDHSLNMVSLVKPNECFPNDSQQISSHHVYHQPKSSFWPFGSFFSSSSKNPSLAELKKADEIMLNYKASVERSKQSTMKSVHVAGFMDYDPKAAARSAYRVSSTRRENSWFHL